MLSYAGRTGWLLRPATLLEGNLPGCYRGPRIYRKAKTGLGSLLRLCRGSECIGPKSVCVQAVFKLPWLCSTDRMDFLVLSKKSIRFCRMLFARRLRGFARLADEGILGGGDQRRGSFLGLWLVLDFDQRLEAH